MSELRLEVVLLLLKQLALHTQRSCERKVWRTGVGNRIVHLDRILATMGPKPMLGEPEFGALFHQGEKESLYLADVARRVILVVLFDNRTTLGLVKLRVRGVVTNLNALFAELFDRRQANPPRVEAAFLGEAEDEIDKLFGS